MEDPQTLNPQGQYGFVAALVCKDFQWNSHHMSYSLNSLKWGYIGDYIGSIIGAIKGDTRS